MASDKAIVLIHGGGQKPSAAELEEYWVSALRLGLARDEKKLLDAYDAAHVDFIYYASEVEHAQTSFDADLDSAQRRQVLETLGRLKSAKDFRRRHYEELPGKSPLKEFAMDAAASIGAGRLALAKALPELKAYWDDENGWAQRARDRLRTVMEEHLAAGRDVLLISHCVGSVIAYDALWFMQGNARISMWITIGSPLGSKAVASRLAGAEERGDARFPRNILSWHNIAAEDDYVCHDKTLADDFRAMLDHRLIGNITDHIVYNMAVRYGSSNPHHSAGYLVHPRLTRFLAEWLVYEAEPSVPDQV